MFSGWATHADAAGEGWQLDRGGARQLVVAAGAARAAAHHLDRRDTVNGFSETYLRPGMRETQRDLIESYWSIFDRLIERGDFAGAQGWLRLLRVWSRRAQRRWKRVMARNSHTNMANIQSLVETGEWGRFCGLTLPAGAILLMATGPYALSLTAGETATALAAGATLSGVDTYVQTERVERAVLTASTTFVTGWIPYTGASMGASQRAIFWVGTTTGAGLNATNGLVQGKSAEEIAAATMAEMTLGAARSSSGFDDAVETWAQRRWAPARVTYGLADRQVGQQAAAGAETLIERSFGAGTTAVPDLPAAARPRSSEGPPDEEDEARRYVVAMALRRESDDPLGATRPMTAEDRARFEHLAAAIYGN